MHNLPRRLSFEHRRAVQPCQRGGRETPGFPRDFAIPPLVRPASPGRASGPECAELFRDFTDADGRPLQERLDTYRLTAPEYLALIYFADGADDGRCGDENVLANTTPGSRRVSICRRFERACRQDRIWTEVVVIHEALHTLGLGENPPTSYEISARVASRCR